MKDKLAILRSYAATRYLRKWRSRESFLRWQEKRIVRHLETVRARSAFYEKLWRGIPTAEWRTFPAIDKTAMMDHFDELNTVGIRKDEAFELAIAAEKSRDFTPVLNGITVGLSSGTSGHRGLFLVSERERLAWAGAVLAKALPRSLLHREKIAFFLRADSRLYGSVESSSIRFEFFDLYEPIDRHIARLNAYRPTLLVGPPSLLRMLAEAAAAGTLSVAPAKIVSVAEVLDPLDRRVAESTFGQTLHQVYQCTEGFLASTCPYGTLHFNEDIVCIEKEYVDRSRGKFIPVVTDFSRLAQPIVRYRLNDLITERKSCPCGSPFAAIEAIEGRSDDLFYLPSRDGASLVPVFPDLISRAVLAGTDDLSDYKVIQQGENRILLMLKTPTGVHSDPAAAQVAASLGELFRKLGCAVPDLEFAPYRPPEPGVKLRRVERAWRVQGRIGQRMKR